MFFVKVEEDKARSQRVEPDDSQSLKVIEKNGLRVTVLRGSLYSFYFEYDDQVAVGESIVPVTSAEIDNIAKGLAEGVPHDMGLLGSSMLSLVVVNPKTRKITFLRNITNSRPVFYYCRNGVFICSTHFRLMRQSGIALDFDESVLPEFFVYRILVAPRTFCRNIYRLAGGELKMVSLADGSALKTCFWNFNTSSIKGNKDYQEAPSRINSILKRSIKHCFEHYQRPGLLLSGGADSSLLASLAVGVKKDMVSGSTSFSFINPDDQEEHYAQTVADHLDIKHSIYKGTARGYLTGLVESIYHNEEPVAHLQSVMLYLLFKNQSSKSGDLLLCGESADGLFGNDQHLMYHNKRALLWVLHYSGIHKVIQMLTGSRIPEDYRLAFISRDFGRNLKSSRHYLWIAGQYANLDVVREKFSCSTDEILHYRRQLLMHYENDSLLDRIAAAYFLCQSSSTMSVWSKLAESQNIILHFPFADPELIKYVTSLPWSLKAREKKYLIRLLLRNASIPESLISRPKKSFGFPPRLWALPGALFQPIVDMAGEMFEPGLLRSLQTDKTGTAMLLWNMLSIYLWHRLIVDEVSPNDLSGELLDRYCRLTKSVKQNANTYSG